MLLTARSEGAVLYAGWRYMGLILEHVAPMAMALMSGRDYIVNSPQNAPVEDVRGDGVASGSSSHVPSHPRSQARWRQRSYFCICADAGQQPN